MEGLGNDFVVVEGPVDFSPARIQQLCDRRFGVGADGVLEVSVRGPDRIRMRYWNADGGEAEICGNGVRCLARLAVSRGWASGPWLVVETAVGELPAEVLSDGRVRALVGTPQLAGSPFDVGAVTVHPVSVGNPHAVVFVDEPDAESLETLGPKIGSHEAFPDGVNVEIVAIASSREIRMRIWERGVGETMASGTGATAAAYASVTYGEVKAPVAVVLPGGRLDVEFDDENAWMVGPATEVYRGTLP